MIRITVELISARDGHREKLGVMDICNTGELHGARGNYRGKVYRKGRVGSVLREGAVLNWPRNSYNIWRLVARMLLQCFPEEARK